MLLTKKAVENLATDVRKAALGASGIIAAGSFFGGVHSPWNLVVAVVAFSIMESWALYLQMLADLLP